MKCVLRVMDVDVGVGQFFVFTVTSGIEFELARCICVVNGGIMAK